LCEEVHLNLAYRWFCGLGLDGAVPDHSTFAKNRHGRFPARAVVRDDQADFALLLGETAPTDLCSFFRLELADWCGK
jgi:hypothetical protein